MKITYDQSKNEKNIRERGLSFELVNECEWEDSLIWQDIRKDYEEIRICALVPLYGRLHSVVFTRREGMHVISFRKANAREVKRHEKAKTQS